MIIQDIKAAYYAYIEQYSRAPEAIAISEETQECLQKEDSGLASENAKILGCVLLVSYALTEPFLLFEMADLEAALQKYDRFLWPVASVPVRKQPNFKPVKSAFDKTQWSDESIDISQTVIVSYKRYKKSLST